MKVFGRPRWEIWPWFWWLAAVIIGGILVFLIPMFIPILMRPSGLLSP